MENQHVFAVINESPFAFLSYRWLLDHKVPMIGNGVDGTYYQQKGNEAILSSGGNGNPFGDLTYDGAARIMKLAGAKKIGVLAYGAASSSVASAKSLMTYAVPEVGLDPAYTNTSIDFGASDVGAPVLGIKNAGADGVYLPMAAATNVAVAQGLQQNGVDMKAVLMGTGYGQDFLDSPAAKALPDSTIFLTGYKPVELKDAATKQFQADLKKYAKVTGVPDYGMYTGYVLADYAIAAMQKAGKDLTRQAFVDCGPRHRPVRPGRSGLPASRRQHRRTRQGSCDQLRVCPQAGRRQVPALPQERQADPAEARRFTRCASRQQGRRSRDDHHRRPGLAVSATTVVIPETLGEVLTPSWLTSTLSSRFPGIRVTDVIPGPIVERVSTNARFRIECEPDVPPGLSPTLCAKGYFSEPGRVSAQAGVPEACFYRDLADDTGVRTLKGVWAGVDPVTQHGVVITEDVIEAGGVFRDALTPCTVEQTADLLAELAHLHAYGWENPEVASAPWLEPRIGQTAKVRGVKEIRHNFDGAPGVGVPDDMRDPQQLVDAFNALGADQPGAGWTVIHGDMHVGNTFLDGEGRPALIDWQLVQHGHWSIDVAYHIASALVPAARATAERDLLRHYLEQVASGGAVGVPPFDQAWEQYRRSMPYGFFLWGITQFVTQDIIGVLLHRIGTAASELESYEVLLRDG